jgi:hypothetical protein
MTLYYAGLSRSVGILRLRGIEEGKIYVSFAKIPFETVLAYFFQLSNFLTSIVKGHQSFSLRGSGLRANDCLKLR